MLGLRRKGVLRNEELPGIGAVNLTIPKFPQLPWELRVGF